MAKSALVDAGFLVALLSRRDANHRWAAAQAPRLPPPWTTCEAVLSEASHLLGGRGTASLAALLHRGALVCGFRFADDMDAVLGLLEKYADVPMSFADACLVRTTETLNDPVLLTTDSDFRIYRRHGRQRIPCVLPR
ncbi:MAG: type II toxin-antitoxin system VapC family toxin [Reyranella sp.]|uniref:type II toxin-antitoxin system VapC family toxin n=1 Tax=Reyranella sp. TaxID=1929291 RepID=UPI003D09D02E